MSFIPTLVEFQGPRPRCQRCRELTSGQDNTDQKIQNPKNKSSKPKNSKSKFPKGDDHRLQKFVCEDLHKSGWCNHDLQLHAPFPSLGEYSIFYSLKFLISPKAVTAFELYALKACSRSEPHHQPTGKPCARDTSGSASKGKSLPQTPQCGGEPHCNCT